MDFDPELIKKLLMGLPEDYGSKQYYGPNNTVVPQQLPPPPPQKEDNYFSKDRSFASPGLDPFAGAQGSNAKWAFPPSHQTGLDQLLASMPPSPQRDVIPPSPPMYPNTTEIPKTGYPDSGRTGDFTPPYPLSTVGPGAGHNLLDEHSKNLIALENAKRVLGDINPYNPIEQSVNKTYQPMATTPISNEEQGGAAQLGDVRGVHNSLNAGLNAVMGASSISSHIAYAEKPWSSIFNANRVSQFKGINDEMKNTLVDLNDKYGTGYGTKKLIFNDFMKEHPDYKGEFNSLAQHIDKIREKGLTNIPDTDTTLSANRPGPGRGRTIIGDAHRLRIEAMGDRLKEVNDYKNQFGFHKQLVNRVRQNLPDLPKGVTDDQIVRTYQRMKSGQYKPQAPQPTTVGSEVPTKALDMLKERQAQAPQGADLEKQVKDYLGQLGIRHTTHVSPENGSKYINYFPKNLRKGEVPPQIRIPMDPEAHIGRWPKGSPANMIDTGISPAGEDAKFNLAKTPSISNLGNTPYGTDINAIKDAIKYRTSTAPPGENWLIPRDRAPHSTYLGGGAEPQNPLVVGSKNYFKRLNEPEGGYTKSDPSLKMLFSNQTDPTTKHVLAMLGNKTPQGERMRWAHDIQKARDFQPAIQSWPQISANETKTLTPQNKYEIALAKQQNRDPILRANKSDPTTQGLIKIMQSRGGPQNLPGEMSSQQAKNAVSSINHLKTIEPSFVEDLSQHRSSVFDANPAWANTNEKINPGFSDIDRAKMTPKEKYDLAVFDQQISKKLIAMGHDPKDIPNIMKNMDTFDRMKLMHPELFNPFPGKPNG